MGGVHEIVLFRIIIIIISFDGKCWHFNYIKHYYHWGKSCWQIMVGDKFFIVYIFYIVKRPNFFFQHSACAWFDCFLFVRDLVAMELLQYTNLLLALTSHSKQTLILLTHRSK